MVRNDLRWRIFGASIVLVAQLIQVLIWMLSGWGAYRGLVGPLGTVIGGVIMLTTFSRMKLVARGPFCVQCHYDLGGLAPAAQCPECGTPTGRFEQLT